MPPRDNSAAPKPTVATNQLPIAAARKMMVPATGTHPKATHANQLAAIAPSPTST